ncbi:MAG: flagellar hook-associated protein FlgL [Negativicutes bacterium]|nr:flagellar hook-associated protein FlgL [Negativicutes bacterium]MDR3589765.1 flagellar hook-associated protein FlgL [Negativicutes bacterium]
MRITDNILTNQFLYNFNNSLAKVSDLQEQMSSGKAVNKPSDDPVKAVRSLTFKTDLTVNSSFTQNASDAASWMSTSDGAITSAETVIQNIQSLIQSVAVPDPTVAYGAAAQQLNGYINELVNLGNTQIGGRYLFAGQNDKAQPFATTNNADGSISVTYSGTYDGEIVNGVADPHAGTVTMKVSPGAPDPVRDKINVDGVGLFGALNAAGAPQLFQDLQTIYGHLTAASPSVSQLSTDLGLLSNDTGTGDEDHLLVSQTSLGARQAVYQTISTRLTADNVTIKSDLSTNQDLNMSKASIDFQTATNVYNAALSVGAKILPQSLVDYLK